MYKSAWADLFLRKVRFKNHLVRTKDGLKRQWVREDYPETEGHVVGMRLLRNGIIVPGTKGLFEFEEATSTEYKQTETVMALLIAVDMRMKHIHVLPEDAYFVKNNTEITNVKR
jgi:hypothetical protein